MFYSASVPSPGNPSLEAFASTAFTYTGSVGDISESYMSYGKCNRRTLVNTCLLDPGYSVPFNIKSAINAGLHSSDMFSSPDPPYSCPTGNCTWDPFPTLGVSVQCADDTSSYFLNCSEPDSRSWPGHTWRPCTVQSRTDKQTYKPDEFTPFDSHSALVPDSPDYPGSDFDVSNFDFGFQGKPRDTWTSINAGFAEFQWSLARNLLVFPAELERRSVISSESTIEAGYCFFYMNMQVISAEVNNGVYKEHILDSTTLIQPYQSLVDDNTNKELDSTHRIGPSEEGNLTYSFTPDCQTLPAPVECRSKATPKPILITIPRRRYTSLLSAIHLAFPKDNLTTRRLGGLYSSGSGNPGTAEFLYRAHSIPDRMRNIAHYMTVALRANDTILARQNDPTNSTGLPDDFVALSHRVNGTAYVQAVHLHVRWAWLAFPATLLVLTAVLLFETIRTSRPDNIGIWKNNALAVLLNTQWKPEPSMIGAATSDGLDKIAKGLEARVVQGAEVSGASRLVTVRKRHLHVL